MRRIQQRFYVRVVTHPKDPRAILAESGTHAEDPTAILAESGTHAEDPTAILAESGDTYGGRM